MRLNTGSVSATKTWSREASLNSKRTVRASRTRTRAMPATAVWYAGEAPLPESISKLWRTSSASTGSPLLKRASGRSLKVTADRSGSTHSASATRPYMDMGSSCDRWHRPSTIQISTPAGALPRVVQGLYLSKLLRRSGLRRRIVPPTGARGCT